MWTAKLEAKDIYCCSWEFDSTKPRLPPWQWLHLSVMIWQRSLPTSMTRTSSANFLPGKQKSVVERLDCLVALLHDVVDGTFEKARDDIFIVDSNFGL
jgi:hypothetical protein